MRGLMLLALAMIASPAGAASKVPVKTVAAKPIALATNVEWPGGAGTRSWSAGGVTATLARRVQGDSAMPVLTVFAPGKASFRIVIDDGVAGYSSCHLAPRPSPVTGGYSGTEPNDIFRPHEGECRL